ncbi:MAG: hypothetical protein HN703_01175 [Planctomycetaceae bacterium]|nr:hypothetical protein [Planctomycetaceae bacterium]
MQYVFIGLIVILLLAGAVALVLGRQGINRTTLVFAWLVLVTTAGFIFLAGRVGERERIWREKVRDLNAQIRTTTFGTYAGKVFFISDTADSEAAGLRQKILQLGGSLSNSKTIRSNVDVVVVNDPEKIPPKAKELSLEVLDKTAINNALTETLQGLEAAIIQKRREQARIETWRNRHWSSAFFIPPKVEPEPGNVGLYKAVSNGELRLILSAEDSEKPVNTGAELALFNLATDDERGFLGIFSIEEVGQREGNLLALSIAPLTTPDAHDLAAWKDWSLFTRAAKNPRIAVYEDLPSSNELSFDALTALVGTEIKTAAGPIASSGLEGMRRNLLQELSRVGNMTAQISLATAATQRERDRKKETANGLMKDREAWKEDSQFAQGALAKLEARGGTLKKNLQETRTRVLALRTELEELNARLMAEINRAEKPKENSSATRGTAALR